MSSRVGKGDQRKDGIEEYKDTTYSYLCAVKFWHGIRSSISLIGFARCLLRLSWTTCNGGRVWWISAYSSASERTAVRVASCSTRCNMRADRTQFGHKMLSSLLSQRSSYKVPSFSRRVLTFYTPFIPLLDPFIALVYPGTLSIPLLYPFIPFYAPFIPLVYPLCTPFIPSVYPLYNPFMPLLGAM